LHQLLNASIAFRYPKSGRKKQADTTKTATLSTIDAIQATLLLKPISGTEICKHTTAPF
jgi:hypothetical protein